MKEEVQSRSGHSKANEVRPRSGAAQLHRVLSGHAQSGKRSIILMFASRISSKNTWQSWLCVRKVASPQLRMQNLFVCLFCRRGSDFWF